MAKTSTTFTGPVNIGAEQTVTLSMKKLAIWHLTVTSRWDCKRMLDFSCDNLSELCRFIETIDRLKSQLLTYRVWRE